MSFSGFLKADTSVKVVIGPVVAVGDGFTPVTNLALGTADEAEILKHDAAAVTDISAYTFAAITGADGYYNLTLPVGAVDTEGMLIVLINDDSLCLPVKATFEVVNANVYDSLFAVAATDYLQVDGIQVSGTSQTANDNGADINTILSRIIGTLAAGTHNPQTGDSYARIGATGSGLTSLAQAAVCTAARLGELDAANLPTDVDTLLTRLSAVRAGYLDNLSAGAVALAATALSNAVWTDAKAAFLDHSIATVDGVADGIQTDLSNATDGLGALKALIDAVQADLDNGTDGLGALKALIDALNDLSAADVNAQVLDVLNTDTFAEPGQAAPPATTTLVNKISYLYKFMRNLITNDGTDIKVYDDAGTTVDQKAPVSEAAGVVSRGEFISGP